jgi:hypothetical protein
VRTSWPLRRQHVPRFALAAAIVLLGAVSVVLAAPASPAAAGVSPGVTQRVSVFDDGSQYPKPGAPFGQVSDDAVSGNGRYVGFSSIQQLDPVTKPFVSNVYVRDLNNPGHTVLISRGSFNTNPTSSEPRASGSKQPSTRASGSQPPTPEPTLFPTDAASNSPSLSETGRYVAFSSLATNIDDGDLVPSGSDGGDIVICDRDPGGTGTFDRRNPDGSLDYTYIFVGDTETDESGRDRVWNNVNPTISADGTTISWEEDPLLTDAPEHVVVAHLSKDTNGDLTAPDPSTYLTVQSSDPEQPNAGTFSPRLSADGNHVAYLAFCPSCAPDSEFTPTILDVEDLRTGNKIRLDVDTKGKPLAGNPALPTISGDGQEVAWQQQPPDEVQPSQVMAVTTGLPNTEIVASMTTAGTTGEGQEPWLSTDGRYIAFDTNAANMSNGIDTTRPSSGDGSPAPGATGLARQVVVRDLVVDAARVAGKQARLPAELATPSVTQMCEATVPPGETCGANNDSFAPALNDDGGVVVYFSNATDLVPADTNNETDAFARQFRPTVTASPVSFGNVTVGSNGTRTVTVQEVGFGPVHINTVTITGPDGQDFTIFPADNCTGAILHEFDTCLVGLRFGPSTTGNRNGGVTMTVSDGNPPVVVPVSGSGVAAVVPVSAFQASPNPLNFPGSQLALTSNGPQFVTVTDTGNGPLKITTVTVLTGASLFPGDYTITSDTCANTTLQPGGTCQVGVTNTLHGSGSRPGALEFNDNAGNSPQLVGLTATGTTPTLSVSPTVVVAGRVTTVTGSGWPAGQQLILTVPKLPGLNTLHPKADASGHFTAELVVFSHAQVGTWEVNGTESGTTLQANTTMLVVLGTFQPPKFNSRDGD